MSKNKYDGAIVADDNLVWCLICDNGLGEPWESEQIEADAAKPKKPGQCPCCGSEDVKKCPKEGCNGILLHSIGDDDFDDVQLFCTSCAPAHVPTLTRIRELIAEPVDDEARLTTLQCVETALLRVMSGAPTPEPSDARVEGWYRLVGLLPKKFEPIAKCQHKKQFMTSSPDSDGEEETSECMGCGKEFFGEA